MLFQEIFIIMPMFVCLFWVILLLISRRQNLAKRYLAFFLFLSTINYFVHAVFFAKEYELFGFLDNLWIFTSLASYPLYYYYLRLLTKDEKIDLRWIWLIVPSILLSVFSFWVYFSMSPEELDIFIRGIMYHEIETSRPYPKLVNLHLLRMTIFKIIFVIQVVLTVFCGRRLIVTYNKQIREFYSNTKGKYLTAMKWILYVFVFASVISMISCIIGREYFVNNGLLIAMPSILHSLFLFAIGYVGYYQNFTIADLNKDLNISNEIERQVLDGQNEQERMEGFMNRLDALVSKEKLFRNPELRIADLVSRSGSNRTYISQTINEIGQMNFCEWINSYRVEYAKEIITDINRSNLTMGEIAELSGFSSKSVFYRVFKEKYGMSPGAYRQKIQNK